ncbi:translation initiation factor IF-2 [Aureococcus anophagefferens]|nr:translation initiation factor IF-2 [Aureococcus anophagefferens]
MAAAAASPPAAWQQNVALLSTDAPGAKDDGEASDERKAEGQESPRGGGWNTRGTAWVHGEKARGALDVTGDAATAIAKSNELPEKHRPHRVPRIGKFFRRHIKKPTRRIKPPKGKVIDGRHEQYTLSYTMQLGIQRSVEYAHGALPDSFDAACAETIKTKFPPERPPSTRCARAFTAKDYAPCVFSRIRALMGVTPELYLESLCSGLSFIDFIANSRSGQFFFYSFDGVFMIKTRGARRVVLPNGSVAAPRFYGLHCTKLKHLRRKVHFVVMSSIYGANTSSRMTQFDLKGRSSTGREGRGQGAQGRGARPRVKLRVDKAKADALLDSARHDAAFLARHGVMDYSLLVGIFTPKDGAAGALSPAGDAAPQPPHDSSPRPSLSAGQSTQALSEFNSRHFSRLPSSLSVAAESARRSFRGAPPGDGGVAAGGLDDDEDDAGRPAATPSKAGHDDRPPRQRTIRKHIETDINIVTKGLGRRSLRVARRVPRPPQVHHPRRALVV